MSDRVPDVFISYSSKDREWVSGLAQALKLNNYRVWWDQELIAGENFHDEISEELDRARCVVVVWSENSVNSDWVRGEADQASERSVLIPISIESARVPTAFRGLHTIDFNSWSGSSYERCFQELAKAINHNIHEESKKPESFKLQGISQKIIKAADTNKKQRGCSVAITVSFGVLLLSASIGVFYPPKINQVSVGIVFTLDPVENLYISGDKSIESSSVEQALMLLGNACATGDKEKRLEAYSEDNVFSIFDRRDDVKNIGFDSVHIEKEELIEFIDAVTKAEIKDRSAHVQKNFKGCMSSLANQISDFYRLVNRFEKVRAFLFVDREGGDTRDILHQ